MVEHKLVVEAFAYLDSRREDVLKYAELLPLADEAIAAHGQDISDGVYVSLEYMPYETRGVTIHATVKAMKEVVSMIRFIRQRGGLKVKSFDDSPASSRRTYNFEGIRIMAMIASEGATCQYVQVGVKEEPVYALKCDDEAKPEPAPAIETPKATLDFQLDDGGTPSPVLELENKEETNAL